MLVEKAIESHVNDCLWTYHQVKNSDSDDGSFATRGFIYKSGHETVKY